jgi:hypothetical protein
MPLFSVENIRVKKMSKSLPCLTSGLIVFALLVGCLAAHVKAKEEFNQIEQPSTLPFSSLLELKWRWYENKEFGFRFKIPADWQENKDAKDILFSTPFSLPKVFGVSLHPSMHASIGQMTEAWCKLQELEHKNSYWEIIEWKNISFKGVPAGEIVQVWETSDNELHRGDILFLNYNEMDYLIMAICLAEDKEGIEIFEKIKSSWEWIN